MRNHAPRVGRVAAVVTLLVALASPFASGAVGVASARTIGPAVTSAALDAPPAIAPSAPKPAEPITALLVLSVAALGREAGTAEARRSTTEARSVGREDAVNRVAAHPDPRTDPSARYFTSVASWENKGKDVTFRGETYRWSKHVNFLAFLDMPGRAAQRFQLAMDPLDAAVEARVRGAGWDLVDPGPISRDVDAYQRFVYGSRGEFTVAKDIYVRPRSGWFSDRSVCFLAAGKPVITQETGFSELVPSGEGLLAFATLEEAVAAVHDVAADWSRHARAARAIAEAHFAADKVIGAMLVAAGLR